MCAVSRADLNSKHGRVHVLSPASYRVRRGPWQIAFNFSPLFTQATPELIARYPASGRYLIVARLNNHPCSPSPPAPPCRPPHRFEPRASRASPSLGHPSVEGGSVHGGMNTSVRSKPMIMNAADRCVSLFGETEGRKEGRGGRGRNSVCWNSRDGISRTGI